MRLCNLYLHNQNKYSFKIFYFKKNKIKKKILKSKMMHMLKTDDYSDVTFDVKKMKNMRGKSKMKNYIWTAIEATTILGFVA
jgi:hypothetical protein